MPATLASKANEHQVRILSTSADPHLGSLRAQVLRSAGYDVTYPQNAAETRRAIAEELFDLLIIGHSISTPSAKSYAEAFRERNPEGKVLVVHQMELLPVRADATVRAIDGPELLIQTVARLCGRAPEEN